LKLKKETPLAVWSKNKKAPASRGSNLICCMGEERKWGETKKGPEVGEKEEPGRSARSNQGGKEISGAAIQKACWP